MWIPCWITQCIKGVIIVRNLISSEIGNLRNYVCMKFLDRNSKHERNENLFFFGMAEYSASHKTLTFKIFIHPSIIVIYWELMNNCKMIELWKFTRLKVPLASNKAFGMHMGCDYWLLVIQPGFCSITSTYVRVGCLLRAGYLCFSFIYFLYHLKLFK